MFIAYFSCSEAVRQLTSPDFKTLYRVCKQSFQSQWLQMDVLHAA